jgi:hypothetical protein
MEFHPTRVWGKEVTTWNMKHTIKFSTSSWVNFNMLGGFQWSTTYGVHNWAIHQVTIRSHLVGDGNPHLKLMKEWCIHQENQKLSKMQSWCIMGFHGQHLLKYVLQERMVWCGGAIWIHQWVLCNKIGPKFK